MNWTLNLKPTLRSFTLRMQTQLSCTDQIAWRSDLDQPILLQHLRYVVICLLQLHKTRADRISVLLPQICILGRISWIPGSATVQRSKTLEISGMALRVSMSIQVLIASLNSIPSIGQDLYTLAPERLNMVFSPKTFRVSRPLQIPSMYCLTLSETLLVLLCIMWIESGDPQWELLDSSPNFYEFYEVATTIESLNLVPNLFWRKKVITPDPSPCATILNMLRLVQHLLPQLHLAAVWSTRWIHLTGSHGGGSPTPSPSHDHFPPTTGLTAVIKPEITIFINMSSQTAIIT